MIGSNKDRPPAMPNRSGLPDYIRILPDLRRRAYQRMTESNPVSTLDIVDAFSDLGVVLQQVIVVLLGYCPEEHFAESGSRHYVGSLVAQSTHWHYMRASSFGVGESGSVVQTLTAEGLVRDLERWIGEIVSSLCGTDVRCPNEEERRKGLAACLA
jgi:predicted aconitase